MCNKLMCPLCKSEDVETLIQKGAEPGYMFKFSCYGCTINFMQGTKLMCNKGYCAMFLNHDNKLDISKVMSEEQYSLLVQVLKNQKGLGVVTDLSPEDYYRLMHYGYGKYKKCLKVSE